MLESSEDELLGGMSSDRMAQRDPGARLQIRLAGRSPLYLESLFRNTPPREAETLRFRLLFLCPSCSFATRLRQG